MANSRPTLKPVRPTPGTKTAGSASRWKSTAHVTSAAQPTAAARVHARTGGPGFESAKTSSATAAVARAASQNQMALAAPPSVTSRGMPAYESRCSPSSSATARKPAPSSAAAGERDGPAVCHAMVKMRLATMTEKPSIVMWRTR